MHYNKEQLFFEWITKNNSQKLLPLAHLFKMLYEMEKKYFGILIGVHFIG